MTDILSLIDNALDDYATSQDAMRWIGPTCTTGLEMSPLQAEVDRRQLLSTPPGLLFWARAGTSPESFGGPEWTPLGTATECFGYDLVYEVLDEVHPPMSFATAGRTASFQFTVPPATFRLLTGYVHPRIRARVRAMHCAYSRRLRARRRRR